MKFLCTPNVFRQGCKSQGGSTSMNAIEGRVFSQVARTILTVAVIPEPSLRFKRALSASTSLIEHVEFHLLT